jgi:hypothetical protein
VKTPLLLFYFISLSALAEYRVFNIQITSPTATRTIQSTLDPIQYKELYPLAADEVISYDDTWMCFGRTDNYLALCPNPQKAQIPGSDVSNQSTP